MIPYMPTWSTYPWANFCTAETFPWLYGYRTQIKYWEHEPVEDAGTYIFGPEGGQGTTFYLPGEIGRCMWRKS